MLIDRETGIGRFAVTDQDGKGTFAFVPSGDYLVGAREPVPVGVCDFLKGTKGFLTTFYDGVDGTNNPNEAEAVEIDDSTAKVIALPLVAGKKRYDCYYGNRIGWRQEEEVTPGYSVATRPAFYSAVPGEELYLMIMKDQWEDSQQRTDTSGGVSANTKLIPAGADPRIAIDLITEDRPNQFLYAETPEGVYSIVRVEHDAVLGPHVIYCENEGEYAATAVGLYVVEQLDENPYGWTRAPFDLNQMAQKSIGVPPDRPSTTTSWSTVFFWLHTLFAR